MTRKLLLPLLALAALALPARAVILDTTPFARKIQFTASGYAGASTLENFPILVRLSDVSGFDFADFTTPADELRFTDASGNNLDYEIDTWDSTTGKALVWVSVPSLSGTTTKINAYYAPSSTSGLPAVSSTAVWSSAGCYGVWHMNSVDPADSSPNGYHGTHRTDNLSVVVGRIGDAVNVPRAIPTSDNKGYQDGISCGNVIPNSELVNGYTIEGWCRPTKYGGMGDGAAMFGKGGFASLRIKDATKVILTTPGKTNHEMGLESGVLPAVSNWWHFVATFKVNTNPDGLNFYVNGQLKKTQRAYDVTNKTDATELFLGNNQWNQAFKGDLDEMRLSAGLRSADWIAADYATQNNAAFLSNSGVLTIANLTIPALPEHVSVDSVTTNGAAVVAVNGVYRILGGTSVTVAFAPASGYKLVGSATTNFVMDADVAIPLASIPAAQAIAAPVTLTIPDLAPYHVTLVSVTVGGTRVQEAATANTYTVADGDTVVVTFAAAVGYRFAGANTATVTMNGDTTLSGIPTAEPLPPPEVGQSATKIYGRQTVTLTASATGAASYRWLKNGVPIKRGASGTLTVNWRRPENDPIDTYRAVAVYDVDGLTVESGASAEMAVENLPMGTVISVLARPPAHDYRADYLTFRVLTSGTICWKAFGDQTKTIEYSINNGKWTPITSTSDGVAFSVGEGDLVRFRGGNIAYAKDKDNYSGFEGGTATYDIEGNIMSLLYGDSFPENKNLPNKSYIFCSLFKKAPVVSAEHLVLPATTLKNYCYRALFSYCTTLTKAPELPATTLAQGCYWYMFEQCAITEAPVLNARTLVNECYGHMFTDCALLNRITCFATGGFGANKCLEGWVTNVAGEGTFVKASGVTAWKTGANGIPTGWNVSEDELLPPPEVSFDGETIELECGTEGAKIHYRLGQTGDFALYKRPVSITADTVVEAYSTYQIQTSPTVAETCLYEYETPFQRSNKSLTTWRYAGDIVTTPYSANAIDGHSSGYTKGTFAFDASITLREAQPTYLWFQHADQSADIYVDNVNVGTHWGGYNAFFFDISEYVHSGRNDIRVELRNNRGNYLAPAAGDFNFNATLGNVKLFTSPVLPAMEYGYDGFHVTSTVSDSSATISVTTRVPVGASLACTISDVSDGGSYSWTSTQPSTGLEQTFTTTIEGDDLRLWNGTLDPHLYTVTLEISKDGDLYHRYERPYGFRYYEYVINQIVEGENYTGFLLNGKPYLLRGVCMHDDVEGKANALDDSDYDQEFAIIRELGCNFIRLAHYPHPKEVYDRCDRLGIIVQTEVPCVNNLKSTMPSDYYTHLATQYTDMVQQHFNHPCIVFWGLSNETTTDDASFGKEKIEGYYDLIKGLDPERMVGYVMSHGTANPSGYYNDPNVDWFGCNIYVGWYIDKTKNDPSSQLDARLNNTLTTLGKPMAFSEYGCGGTPHCHSENFKSTTTTGNNPRHDIEYQMWLHEGHIAAIRNYPQLLFTSQWQLFDIAVASRNEGFTECIDGTNVTTNDVLRRLNNKGLVERDHRTKKDTFYLYKAEWNPQPFVHICGKDYTKTTDRVIKCYTNDGDTLSLYVGNDPTPLETVTVNNHIAEFTARDYTPGVEIRVVGASPTTYDTMTFQ